MLKCGDRLLVKKIKGWKLIPEIICWWTDSKYSHIEPIYRENGDSVDASFPKLIESNIGKYFDGMHRVMLIRPVVAFDDVKWRTNLADCIGKGYDLLSYLGFVFNKNIQDKAKYNCSELVLLLDRSACILRDYDSYIRPESYYDFAIAGMFEIVFQKDFADMNDFNKLREDK